MNLSPNAAAIEQMSPTPQQVEQAMAVIENCSNYELQLLGERLMSTVSLRNVVDEVAESLSQNYPDEFDAWAMAIEQSS